MMVCHTSMPFLSLHLSVMVCDSVIYASTYYKQVCVRFNFMLVKLFVVAYVVLKLMKWRDERTTMN